MTHPLAEIKYNQEGDLLFSASKDHVINVWHSHNGERLGTYDGHNGTVWSIDVDCELGPYPSVYWGAKEGDVWLERTPGAQQD